MIVVANDGYELDTDLERTFEVVLEDDISTVSTISASFEGFNYNPANPADQGGSFSHTFLQTDASISFTDAAGVPINMESHHVVFQYRVLDEQGLPMD